MTNNTAVSQGGAIYATEATLTMVKNIVMMNFCINDELRGLVVKACNILLNGNNVIEGAKTIDGNIKVTGVNTIK
jgi:predicted outer membrane repeat protein